MRSLGAALCAKCITLVLLCLEVSSVLIGNSCVATPRILTHYLHSTVGIREIFDLAVQLKYR
jgi:hypothetical protein